MLFSFLHSKCCYPVFSCLFITWLLPDILPPWAGPCLTLSSLCPRHSESQQIFGESVRSLLLLGKLFPRVHSASLPLKRYFVIFFTVLWLIRKYILKPTLPPNSIRNIYCTKCFCYTRKMRQQIHNSVIENDMKMTKYNIELWSIKLLRDLLISPNYLSS